MHFCLTERSHLFCSCDIFNILLPRVRVNEINEAWETAWKC